MGLSLIKKMFGMRNSEKEENVSEKVFGNNLKFRVGSSIHISDHVLTLWPTDGLFNRAIDGKNLSNLVVESIYSVDFQGTQVWRLYCKPECIIQIQENGNNTEFMLFVLTQEESMASEDEYNEWFDTMNSIRLDNDTDDSTLPEFTNIFSTVSVYEEASADAYHRAPAEKLALVESLYSREIQDETEYLMMSMEEVDWYLNIFVGINIPTQEIKVF